MFDLIIANGSVLDGTGAPARQADLGIKDGKIAAIGRLEAEGPVLDARGMTVTPGFLDIHRHGDLAIFRPGFGELELRQGLTTIINGNCGLSAAPFGPAHREEILRYLSPVIGTDLAVPGDSMAAYLRAARALDLPLHVGMLAGAGVIRADLVGYRGGSLSNEEYRALHARIERALADGALGISLGLGYAPECFYDTQGLIRALEPLAGSTIPVTVHMRDEGTAVPDSVEEMCRLATALRCPVEISHLKCIGRENWGIKIPRVLARLQQAVDEGLDLRWDVYPYTAGSTQLLHILPPEVLEGGTEALCRRLKDPLWRERIFRRFEEGEDFNNISRLVGWDNILLSTLRQPENLPLQGLSIAQAARQLGQAPEACALDLLAAEHGTITMIDFITCEQDIAAILRTDRVSVISDSTYPTGGKPHPRLYGNFVRLIEKYVYQDRVLTLAQAVHKMTGAPARALGLTQKGVLAVGKDADINLFDPAALHEAGTYLDPARMAQGMDTVLVMGCPVLRGGQLTGKTPGRVLCREER